MNNWQSYERKSLKVILAIINGVNSLLINSLIMKYFVKDPIDLF